VGEQPARSGNPPAEVDLIEPDDYRRGGCRGRRRLPSVAGLHLGLRLASPL
jgi:hypothetical protein